MSLTTCLKRAGKNLNAEDKNAILEAARANRKAGMSADEAAKAAVRARLEEVQALLAAEGEAQVSTWTDGAPAPAAPRTLKERAEAMAAKPDKAEIRPFRRADGSIGYEAVPIAPTPSANTIFTEDAAAAARARLKAKLGRLQSGIDPETMMDGITLAGYHIEKGARTFAAYARAMVADLGDAVKPYLQSWYMAVRSDPRAGAFKADMDKASAVEDLTPAEIDALAAESAQNVAQEPTDGNAARALDRPGQRALEGAPADPVQAPGAVRGAGGSAEGSRGADGGRLGGVEGASGPAGGVGDGAGALPVPARGTGRKPRGEPKPRAGRNARPDTEPGLFGDSAGPDPQELTAPNVAPPAPPAFTPTDFEITDDLALGEGGQKAKYRGNVEAIRLLRDLEATGRTATQAEQRVLARYVGWGGISQAFDGSNKDWAREYMELRELLTPEEWATANESTQYAHYTSREIIGGIYEALARMGFTGGKILEPGSGVGNFVGLMPAGLRTSSRFTGVEREALAVGIAKQLYPLQNIQRADFTEFIGNDGYFDLAIGNPPFARNPLTDKSGRKHLTGLSVHNYFFAKAVDMLREGGILAQVVSNSFLDAKRDTARRYIADRTEFLGAIRLPNNAFAKNANTEVTTDIVFLRKLPESEWGSRSGKENRDRWLDLAGIVDPEGGPDILINRYFQENPEMMLGRMGRFGTMYGPGQPALVARPGQDTAALLKAAIARLPAGVYTAPAVANTAAATDAAIVALKNPQVQEGGHYVEGDKLYQRLQDIAGEARAVEITPATMWTEKTRLGDDGYARIKGLAGLRKTLRDLLAAELADSKDIAPLRKRLNAEYDAYVAKHGLINDRPSARVFDDDPDYPLLASLEHGFTPGITLAAARKMGVKPMPATAKKGPIFSARVIEKRTAPSRAESPADALNISMAERGRIDAGYIGLLLGRDGEEALREMSTGDKPLLFMDPASNEYVLRDAYLSGNVRSKLAQARQAGMMNNARALEAVQPPDVSAGEISVRVGSPWVPGGIYEDFARHLFGAGTKAKFTYVKANSSYMATISSGSDVADSSTWGTSSYPGTQILTSLMNNREIKVMFKDADGSLKVHKESTEAANQKATEIKQAFSDWAFADSDRADALAKAYNEANNNYVTRAFDGAYMQFPGKVPDSIIKFRRHQRNAIARIVQDRTALLDHVVGAGKTYTVISAAMELKRTGLANKPLIMVPNHLVKQWASDFYRLYPGANILTATKKDFEKTNRRRFLAKIATGNWDAVIMAHSSFGFIKPAPEFEAQFNEKQVENVLATIKAVEDGDGDDGVKKRTVKQLAALKERLENRIDALRQKPIDALLDFKEIGVDQLFVDEAHLFKNLMFTTKMQNVRGLGDAAGSQRAYDLFIKANQLYAQNGRGQGVVFATGTPVSNSLAEMYHMMRYLMPQALQDGGFESFDAWANTFASVEQVWMQKISADGFKADNRMSNFVNTHELLKMFDQVADTVTMDDIKRAYSEENNGAEFPLPKLKTGRRQPVSLVKSEAQIAYMDAVAARAAAIEGKRTNEKGMDNALKIMGDARKAAMDIRLVDMERTEREKGGRIDRAADEILSRHKKYASVKGTQLVFSDLGTPIKHAKAEMKEWEALQARISKGVDPEIVTAANLGNEAAMKAVDDAEDAQREMDEKGADWLDAVKAALRGFSVYDDLRAALVERGIPDAEIAFIHDYNTDEQKLSLFRKVNAGDIRVLIGSTPKLGAGTNVQDRLVALHHLDVPWKPSDVEQREGRIIRQGNLLALEKLGDKPNPMHIPGFEVEILAYVTQDTLDMRMWQVQETKLKMINQLRTRQISREIDNAFEDMEMSAGEMQAAATGNMDLLKEIQLRTDVKKLEQAKRSFDAQRNDLASRKKRAEEAVSALPAKIAAAEKMAVASKVYTDEQKAQAAGFKVTINGKTYTDPREAGAVLQGFVDAKQYTKKGSDEVLTPEQYQAMDEDERAASKGWQERPVPLKVEMDGKTYTARAALGEAFADIRGDAADPPMWKADGQTFIRRTKAAAAIAQRVADAIADSRAVEVGKIGPFAVTVEGQGENKYYEGSYGVEVLIAAPGGVEASTTLTVKGIASEDDARKAATSIINAAISLASGGETQARWLREDLTKQKKVLADLATAKTLGEFPQQAKLDEARAAHREVLARLSATQAPLALNNGNELILTDEQFAQRFQVPTKADLKGRYLVVTAGGFAYRNTPAGGFATEDEARQWLKAEGAKNSGKASGDDAAQPALSRAPFRAGFVSPRTLRDEVAKIVANWDQDLADVRVVNRVEDLPDDIRQAVRNVGSENTVRGLAMPDGRVFLVAENISSLDEGRFVLFHEVYGHVGMQAFLGDGYATQMRVLRTANPALAREADAWLDRYGEDEIAARVKAGFSEAKARAMVAALAVEEALADRAGTLPELKGWKLVMAALQRGLRRLGLGSVADMLEGMTEAETVDLLVQARRTVQAGQRVRGVEMAGNPAFQRVWHGTHTRGIEEFSTDYIGTGEGVQAFGWGLYFATKKEIAEHYREKLSAGGKFTLIDGKRWDFGSDLSRPLTESERLDNLAVGMLQQAQSASGLEALAKRRDADPAVVKRAREMLPRVSWAPSGQTYEVDIPEDSEMLLWDKPLSEQPAKVREALKNASPATTLKAVLEGKTIPELLNWVKSFDRNSSFDEMVEEDPSLTADDLRAAIESSYDAEEMAAYLGSSGFDANRTGESMYRELTSKIAGGPAVNAMTRAQLNDWYEREVGYRPDDDNGSPLPLQELRDLVAGFNAEIVKAGDAPRTASLYLKALGIKGIKYLDGTSRGTGGKAVLSIDGQAITPSLKTPQHERDAHVRLMRMNGSVSEAIQEATDTSASAQEVAYLRSLQGRNVSVQRESESFNYVIFDGADAKIQGALFSRRTSQDILNAGGGVQDFSRYGTTKQDRIRGVTDKAREFWLGALTRDQIADVYGGQVPQVREYDGLVRSMENERSSLAQRADDLYQRWAKLDAETNDKLGRIMLDATTEQVNPDSDDAPADKTKVQIHAKLRAQFKLLPREAQAMYREVRDFHSGVLKDIKNALIGRIERQVAAGAERAALLSKVQQQFDQYLENGPYFPLSRFGDYLVIATRPDGERVVAAYENSGEQQAAARELRKDGFTTKLKTAKEYARSQDGNAGKFIGDVIQAVEKVDMAEATLNGSRTDLKNQLLDDLNQLFIRSLPDLSYRKHFAHRKNTPGFSADVMRGFASSAFHAASYIARLNHADRMTMNLQSAYEAIDNAATGDFNTQTQVLNELSKRHEAMLNPNTHPLSALATQVGFVMYLGLSPAAGLINMLQVPMVTIPYLGARYGFGKASAAMSKAYADIMKAPPNVQSGFNAAQSLALSADERRAISTLQDEGVIDLTQAHDLAAATDRDVGDLAKNKTAFAMARAMRIVGWTFHVPEVMNRQTTALMAYRLEREKGADHETALEQAREAIKRTQFDYSSSNRARYMQGNIARVVLQFKQFSQNMTYFLGRAAHQALKGESPEVRSIARRQILSTFAVTGAMAGSLGLPGIGFVMGLVGALVSAMDDEDEPWDWQTEYRNMLSDAMGKDAAEVFARGVPRALMPGWDTSNLVSLNELWWRSNDREGQNPRESFATDMANVLGPTAGTLLGWYVAADHMSRGAYDKAAEAVVPKFIRDPLKAYREGTDGVTSYAGDPLMDVNAWEVLGRSMGFAPSRVSEMYEGRNAVMNTKTALDERRQRLLNRVVKARMDGDTEAESEARTEVAQFNRRNPDFKITNMTIARSLMNRRRNRENTEQGILLPDTKASLRELGRFANVE